MHRSRTSSIALLLDGLGVDMGKEQLASDQWNPEGYGEEQRVVALHREILHAHDATVDPDRSWIDWGWPLTLPIAIPKNIARRMSDYVGWRSSTIRSGAITWGWKDPRTTLFLPQWAQLLPSAIFLLVYRHPVGVYRSMERLEFSPTLLSQSFDIWGSYNRAILSFAAKYRSRCSLVESNSCLREPGHLSRLLANHHGLSLPNDRLAQAAMVVRQDLLNRSRDDDNSLPHASPSAADLWVQLNQLADMPES
jgi:hypothetical protein